MINIQQYYIEQYAQAAALRAGCVDIRRSARVSAVPPCKLIFRRRTASAAA